MAQRVLIAAGASGIGKEVASFTPSNAAISLFDLTMRSELGRLHPQCGGRRQHGRCDNSLAGDDAPHLG